MSLPHTFHLLWEPEREKKIGGDLIAMALYAIGAVVFTYPYLFRFNHFIAGADADYCQRLWMFWWFKKALFNAGESLYFTDYLYAPHGCSLILTPLSEFNSFMSILFSPFLSLVDTHQLLIIFHFAFAAFAMYKLAGHFVLSPGAAFVGGMVAGFAGYRATHELIFASTGWIILTMLFFLKMFHTRQKRYGILAGASYAMSCLCAWYYLIFLLIFFCVFILYFIFARRSLLLDKKIILPYGLFILAFFLLILLFVIPFVKPLLVEADAFSKISVQRQTRVSPDLLGFPVWERTAGGEPPVINGEPGVYYDTGFIIWPAIWGYPVLILAVAALLARPDRRTFFWWAIFFVFFLLSLGPYLQVQGKNTGIPLPLLYLFELPVFSFARGAHRFIMMQTLALSVLAAIGCDALLVRDRAAGRPVHRRFAIFTAALLSVIIFVEFINIPHAMSRVPLPRIYTELQDREEAFSVLEIPFGTHFGSLNMYYQTIHGKKLLDGHLGRVYQQKDLKAWLTSTPLIRELVDPDRLASLDIRGVDREACRRILVDAGVGCVILNHRRPVGTWGKTDRDEPFRIRRKNNLVFMPLRSRLSEDVLLMPNFRKEPYPLEKARALMIHVLGPPSRENADRAVWWF
jgi:hypothetical protein